MPLPGRIQFYEDSLRRIQFSEDSLRRISSLQMSGITGASYAAPLEVRRVSCVSRVALEAVTVMRAASVLARVGATLRFAHGGPIQELPRVQRVAVASGAVAALRWGYHHCAVCAL